MYGYLFGGLEYLFLCRILVWNKSLRYEYLMEWLFGLVVVLNRGKFCIDKRLGFRRDVVRFFKTHVFVLAITWSLLIQIE